MKKLLLLIFSLYLYKGYSQLSIGVETIYTYNKLKSDISNRTYTQSCYRSGAGVGIMSQFNVTNKISLQSGFYVVQKNYEIKRTDNYIGVYESVINNYGQLPINIHFRICRISRFNISIYSGCYISYWYSSTREGEILNIFDYRNIVNDNNQVSQYYTLTSYSEKNKIDLERDRRYEFGISNGIKASFSLKKKISVFSNLSFCYSLTDQQKKYMINQTKKLNQTFIFSIGALYTFKKRF